MAATPRKQDSNALPPDAAEPGTNAPDFGALRVSVERELAVTRTEVATLRAKVALLRQEFVRDGHVVSRPRDVADPREGTALTGAARGAFGRSLAARVIAVGTLSWRSAVIPVGLYVFTALLLLVRLGSHPPFAYNWEHYTAWAFFQFWDEPSRAVFRLTDGLMTESGMSPLIALPAWIGFTVGGVGLMSLRVPIVLIGAGAGPLLWLVGRRIAGPGPALLAAMLLALSPAFLLYARTATLVGLSLVPALATIYALMRVLQEPRQWRWLLALQVLLVIGAFAYAPIRFLWPLGVALLVGEFLWRGGARRGFLLSAGTTLVSLPIGLMALGLDTGDEWDPVGVARIYFNGRGEQVLAMSDQPAGYEMYLRMTPEEVAAGGPQGTPEELAQRLIAQNAGDYVALLLDRNTLPAITDYWNPHGRLYAGVLVPFFLLGLVRAMWRARRFVEYRALLVLFFGFGLPLLLTSQVHIGRLVFAMPLLFLIVAIGFMWASEGLGALLRARTTQRLGVPAFGPMTQRRLVAAASLLLVVVVAQSSWVDYRTPPAQGREEQTVAMLKDARDLTETAAPGAGVAMVFGDLSGIEIEAVNFDYYRLELDERFRFINLATDEPRYVPEDQRTPLYYGGLLDYLAEPGAIPGYCANIYFVAPSVELRFIQVMEGYGQACGGSVDYRLLPW